MAQPPVAPSAEFTKLVVASMRRMYPEEGADRTWDNVGLLLDNSSAPSQQAKVLLTNDLTLPVAKDAIQQGASVIISYHPIIFSGLKAITHNDAQQSTLLLLARNNVAVYCPHTAVDAGGLNTWLQQVVAGSSHAEMQNDGLTLSFANGPVPLAEIATRLASRLGGLKYVMIASPPGTSVESKTVRSFAVCAGSGYSVIKDSPAELLVLGETSHHSALRAIQQGQTVVQVFHSNSERAYLRQVLRSRLEAALRETDDKAEVVMSDWDKEPFDIVAVSDLRA
ncbi:hypothetical protein CDD81_3342 [Ophiocordyceps australis]|uniref:Uncharacterized protein n=1 Tax=Ophiocordyceps australis TaxID=1399860 RepID=A0A2C5XXL5_9HYPO|nr:hypothetical protein CDD81_3342 [Ophiocordyceps australis]